MAYFDKYGVEFSDDRKTLVKCPEDFHGEYEIPDSVTSIGDKAFRYCKNLVSITIPGSVASIGSYAFYECKSLTFIVISYGVTSIGDWAFRACTNLTTITIPNSVTDIGRAAFYYCTGLTSIEIPNSVTRIGGEAFQKCTNLTSITLPSGITSIGEFSFQYCEKLTSIVIPNSVKVIGESAFSRCRSLNSIVIPNSVTRIGDYAFAGCWNLTSIVISNGVTNIGDSAFRYCKNLVSITLPNSVTSIGREVFRDCINLTTITISNSATSIEKHAFPFCYNLQKIIIPKGQKERFAQMEGLKDLKDKIVEASIDAQKPRTWEEVNAEYRAYFERKQKENPNIQNKNGGTPLEFPPFGIELSIQEFSQFKNEGRTIHSWMFWCKSGNEIHELARLYAPVNSIGLSTPRQGYYKIVGIEGEGNDTMLVCYYNLFSPNEFFEEEDEKVRIKQKPLFNKRSSCAGTIEVGDIIHVKSTELVEDMYDGRTYQAYKIKWEFV